MLRSIILITVFLFSSSLQADARYGDEEGDNSVKHLLAYDEAQSALKYAKTLGHLSAGVQIAVKKCDGKVEKLDYMKAAKSYKGLIKTAKSMEIKRDIIKVEKASEGSGYLVHSKLSEKIIAGDKQVRTTVSQEVAHVKKFASHYQIAKIDSQLTCKEK